MKRSGVGILFTTGQVREMVLFQGVVIDIYSRLQYSVVGVTPVDERMMLMRLKHTFEFISLFAVYSSTGMCELK